LQIEALFQLSQTLDEIDLRLFHDVYRRHRDDIELQVSSYLGNVGFRKYHILKLVRSEIVRNIRQSLTLTRDEDVIDKFGRLQQAVIGGRHESSNDRWYLDVIEDAPYAVLRAGSINEWMDENFPNKLSFATRQQARPSLKMYHATQGVLYADACGFQIYDADLAGFFWSGSPYCYSNVVLAREIEEFPGDIIVLADFFNGANFCHFIFDWLGRLNAFMESQPPRARRIAFVASCVPGPLHKLLVDAVCDIFTLDQSQFIFPTGPRLLRAEGSIRWFSDAYENNTHPGQLMHPATVHFMRQLASRLERWSGSNPTSSRRLYISRADARARKVSNEQEIRDYLAQSGFQIVELAHLAVADQIRAVTSADIIVGPHGMGLTHLAFHERSPTVVELFHPEIGTDVYAVLSRSLGFTYRYVIGEAVSGLDFEVPVDRLADALRDAGFSKPGLL